jgi:hypothetical protein
MKEMGSLIVNALQLYLPSQPSSLMGWQDGLMVKRSNLGIRQIQPQGSTAFYLCDLRENVLASLGCILSYKNDTGTLFMGSL